MPYHKNKPFIFLVFFVLIFFCCLFTGCCILFWRVAINNNSRYSVDESVAINLIKAKYHEVQDYPNDSLPPRSIKTSNADGGWYIAFIQQGSGRPILEAKCYWLDGNKNVSFIGSYLPSTSEDSAMDFSPKTCLPVGYKTSSSSSTPTNANCQVTNCHGLDITCGAVDKQLACTALYAIGDRCMQYATCGTVDGNCQQTENVKFTTCKSCVLDCSDKNKDDASKLFACEAKC